MEQKFSKGKQVGGKFKNKKATFKESDLQKACEKYLDMVGLAYIRIPDSLYRSVFGTSVMPVHIKKQISGCIKGAPDLTILFKNSKYVCVELKTNIGKLSIGQKRFRNGVTVENYYVIRDVQDFVNLIKEKRE